MAKTYTDSITASRDRVRLLMADTDPATALFTDDEVDGAITYAGGVEQAAAYLHRALAAAALKRGDSAVSAAHLAMAQDLDPAVASASSEFPGLLPFDPNYTETL